MTQIFGCEYVSTMRVIMCKKTTFDSNEVVMVVSNIMGILIKEVKIGKVGSVTKEVKIKYSL